MIVLAHGWRHILGCMFSEDAIAGHIMSFDTYMDTYTPTFFNTLLQHVPDLRAQLVQAIFKLMVQYNNLTFSPPGLSRAFMNEFVDMNKVVLDMDLRIMSHKFISDHPTDVDKETWQEVLNDVIETKFISITDQATILRLGARSGVPATVIVGGEDDGKYNFPDYDDGDPITGTREEYIFRFVRDITVKYEQKDYNNDVLQEAFELPEVGNLFYTMPPVIQNPRTQYQTLARLFIIDTIVTPTEISDSDFTILVDAFANDSAQRQIHGYRATPIIEQLQNMIPGLKQAVFQAIWATHPDADFTDMFQKCLTSGILQKRYSDAFKSYHDQRYYLAQTQGLTYDVTSIIESYWW